MTEVPPGREDSDDVDDLYRRASDLDASRPSDSTRRRILHHAAQMAEQRAAGNDAARFGRRRGAKQPWRRPAIFGTLAAAALAGLLVTPRFFAPGTPPTAAVSPSQSSQPSSATSRQSPEAAADVQPSTPSPAQAQGNLKPQAFARNSAPSAEPAAELAAKNAPPPTAAQSGARARSGLVASDRAEDARRMQATSGTSETSELAAALRGAAETGDIQQLQMLLDKQPVIDARDAGGRTALMLATLHGRGQAVDMLLAHGADPNAADGQGATPLQAAVAAHQQAIVEALQRAGAR